MLADVGILSEDGRPGWGKRRWTARFFVVFHVKHDKADPCSCQGDGSGLETEMSRRGKITGFP